MLQIAIQLQFYSNEMHPSGDPPNNLIEAFLIKNHVKSDVSNSKESQLNPVDHFHCHFFSIKE